MQVRVITIGYGAEIWVNAGAPAERLALVLALLSKKRPPLRELLAAAARSPLRTSRYILSQRLPLAQLALARAGLLSPTARVIVPAPSQRALLKVA